MPARQVYLSGVPAEVRDGLQLLQTKLGLNAQFPAEVEAAAKALAAASPGFSGHLDRTDLALVTIDPASSMDLDQALLIEPDGDDFIVYYAIADVGAWVKPGSVLDLEAQARGQSLYAPGAKIPLHPKPFSEAAASLLADGKPRPAMVWIHRLDKAGQLVETRLERAMVRSRAKLSYEQAQAAIEAGTADESLQLLAVVGKLRQQIEIERGGISLNLPEQEIIQQGDTWDLVFRELLPVEGWNAQISLMTGIAAANLMIQGKVGILRTLPPAESYAIERLRRAAKTLGVEWAPDQSYPGFVRSLDPADPKQLAVMVQCTALFRGAGYLAFEGELPQENIEHAALATPYAHATAPLRRLVDRYVLEICHSLANGLPVPDWALKALAELPSQMQASARRASTYERGVLDLAEALVMQGRVGEIFEAVVIDVNPKTGMGTLQIATPAVEIRLPVEVAQVGQAIRVQLVAAAPTTGELTFAPVYA